MKLLEGQVWKSGALYLRIVRRERLSVEYKAMKDPRTKEGTLHEVSKKEFCRMLHGAVLLTPEEVRAIKGLAPARDEAARTVEGEAEP